MIHRMRQLLRADTQELHDQIEAQPAFARILESTANTNDYIRFLGAQYLGHIRLLGVDCQSLNGSEWRTDEAPDLASCLRQDLHDLNVRARPERSSPSDHCVVSGDQFLGISYVLEGSALGSRVIYRRLSEKPWFDGLTARRFLDAMRLRARQWPAFVAALESQARSSREVIAGARRAFAAFYVGDSLAH